MLTQKKLNAGFDPEAFLDQLEAALPTFCTNTDLVKLGLFGSGEGLRQLRLSKTGPPYVRVSHNKWTYPVKGLVAWLRAGGFEAAKAVGFNPDKEIGNFEEVRK